MAQNGIAPTGRYVPGRRHTFLDLFSGSGGMSCGFHRHGGFEVVGAVDAQLGKPSSTRGSLECNSSYAANIGRNPHAVDLGTISTRELSDLVAPALAGRPLDVLSACPPCTGFSRANPSNHARDDPRNSLVARVADVACEFRPAVVVMENARELVGGNFRGHLEALRQRLEDDGYTVDASVYMLSELGLPQKRERSVVVAVRGDRPLMTLTDLWSGWRVRPEAVTVRRAIADLPPVEAGVAHVDDPLHVSPSIGRDSTRRRLRAIPHDGGSWLDLRSAPGGEEHLTPAMRRSIAAGRLGSHPDVYGRLWWDRPAPTVKRECGHFGNGRYTHPEQDRLCTVRELALLNGFPADYRFDARSLSNMYRHIGDAVPPLISAQLAAITAWILGDDHTHMPTPHDAVLAGTSLRAEDIEAESHSPGHPDPTGASPVRVPLDLEHHQR
ncbi:MULTISPECIES: DNA cytosine methyltransferase [Nocardiaceae]|uniref:DNA (cytosine-5-)-methyltransferase n=1 Tax=Rhodococcoides kroppenstedtii TaxID=293050 RepID=A0ABS7NQZ8_9NOCA|nr:MULTISPECIES: DNA cytosine methyltransferase [Rhodococcus]AMY18758.1 putative BsuMI modification methylase subunit YdiO [Rhodococcus sp. PBTS 1]MBY6313029.1 DNA cytosine methyltransferase [Rhodococcus kroppenstedtii]MBY6320439.1 DNA cytosine methyltransferase [Rhodococcus kroppenstedtii]MBY6399238.1 DNA cytosine methyltransferase [Rhodococcus kroppenstedtii]